MQLTYRGVAYDYEPPAVKIEPTQKMGRYRGVPYRVANLITEPIFQPIRNLVYRGVPYQIGDFTPEEAQQMEKMTPAFIQALHEEELLWLKYQLHPPLAEN
jgi:Domain of unknown function (DUF4278)